jgi:hypothetical protein
MPSEPEAITDLLTAQRPPARGLKPFLPLALVLILSLILRDRIHPA